MLSLVPAAAVAATLLKKLESNGRKFQRWQSSRLKLPVAWKFFKAQRRNRLRSCSGKLRQRRSVPEKNQSTQNGRLTNFKTAAALVGRENLWEGTAADYSPGIGAELIFWHFCAICDSCATPRHTSRVNRSSRVARVALCSASTVSGDNSD